MNRSRKGTSKPTRYALKGQSELTRILSIETLATGTQTSLSSESDLNVQDDFGRYIVKRRSRSNRLELRLRTSSIRNAPTIQTAGKEEGPAWAAGTQAKGYAQPRRSLT
jgi:hypothetical protein